MKKLMYLLIIVINLLLNINLSAQESMLIEFGRPKMYCIFDKHKRISNIEVKENRHPGPFNL